jgi:hypothetical protein
MAASAIPSWLPAIGGPFAEPLSQVYGQVNRNIQTDQQNYQNWIAQQRMAQEYERQNQMLSRQDQRDRWLAAQQDADQARREALARDQQRAGAYQFGANLDLSKQQLGMEKDYRAAQLGEMASNRAERAAETQQRYDFQKASQDENALLGNVQGAIQSYMPHADFQKLIDQIKDPNTRTTMMQQRRDFVTKVNQGLEAAQGSIADVNAEIARLNASAIKTDPKLGPNFRLDEETIRQKLASSPRYGKLWGTVRAFSNYDPTTGQLIMTHTRSPFEQMAAQSQASTAPSGAWTPGSGVGTSLEMSPPPPPVAPKPIQDTPWTWRGIDALSGKIPEQMVPFSRGIETWNSVPPGQQFQVPTQPWTPPMSSQNRAFPGSPPPASIPSMEQKYGIRVSDQAQLSQIPSGTLVTWVYPDGTERTGRVA